MNTIRNNTANSNTYDGIVLVYSMMDLIYNNSANSNTKYGIYIYSSPSNNSIYTNSISNNSVGIYSQNASSMINSNYVCNNTNLDLNSSNWLSSTGINNTCQNPDGWNDNGKTGCSDSCIHIGINSCRNLSVPGSYDLIQNISATGACIVINANNVTLDCHGYTITGPGYDIGIYLNFTSGVTIKNCRITNFGNGIWAYYSSNNTIMTNTANLNSGGIELYNSSNNILTNNTANLNLDGIKVLSSSNNVILTGNTANSNFGAGIELYGNSNSTLTGNTANSNYYGILVWTSTNNLLTNNIANLNSYSGILLQYSANNNIVTSNTANSNQYSGIYLEWSANNNIVTSNTANSNQQFGIGVTSTSSYPTVNNTFNNNTANSNYYGIYSYYSNSTINTNYVCGNTNQDFYSFNWYSSYGVNNMCDKPDGWNDTGKTGCTYSCTQGIFVITILSPQNKSYGTLSVWANATLDKAGNWCGRSLDNGANVTMTNSSGNWNNKMTGLGSGTHTVKFFCNDTSGNMAYNTTQFFYCYSDITGPTVGVPDGTVNMRDINLLITNFNYKCGESRFNPMYDLNDDCTVNMRDINIAIMNFNKKCV
jgi:parallel beta-helix repeat protein